MGTPRIASLGASSSISHDYDEKSDVVISKKILSEYGYVFLPNNQIACHFKNKVFIRDNVADVTTVHTAEKDISSIDILPDGRMIITWEGSKTFSLWDRQKNEFQDMGTEQYPIKDLKVNKQGKIFIQHENDSVSSRDPEPGSIVSTISIPKDCYSELFLLSENRAITLLKGEHKDSAAISVTDFTQNSNTVLCRDTYGSAHERFAELSPGFLATSHQDHSIKVWDLESKVCITQFQTQGVIKGMIALSNELLLTSHWEVMGDIKICLWDVYSGKLLDEAKRADIVFNTKRIVDSRFFAVYRNTSGRGGGHAYLELWELTPNNRLQKLNEFHSDTNKDIYISHINFLADGRFLLSQFAGRDDLFLDFNEIRKYRMQASSSISVPQALFSVPRVDAESKAEAAPRSQHRESYLALAPGGPQLKI